MLTVLASLQTPYYYDYVSMYEYDVIFMFSYSRYLALLFKGKYQD